MNILKFGGGTNSTAMAIGMWQRGIPADFIVFSDTGGERPDTYAFRDLFSDWLVDHGYPPITTVSYRTREGEPLTLEQQCLRTKSLPSIAYGGKSCSQKFKIRTAHTFCKNNLACQAVWARGERITTFIGYDAGEQRRVDHASALDIQDKRYQNRYLLYEWGWTREDCKAVIAEVGLPQPGKSSCFFCPSMKKAEIQALWEQYPGLFARAVDIEHTAAETLIKIKGLGRSWSWEAYRVAFFQKAEAAARQCALDGFADAPGGCLCGAPCGCYDG